MALMPLVSRALFSVVEAAQALDHLSPEGRGRIASPDAIRVRDISSIPSAWRDPSPEAQRRLRVRGLSTHSESKKCPSPGSHLAMRSDLFPPGRGDPELAQLRRQKIEREKPRA